MQQSENHIEDHQYDVVAEVAMALPQSPSVVRYYDAFEETTRSISGLETATKIEILAQGLSRSVDLSFFDTPHALLLKRVFVFLLGEDLSPQTVIRYIDDATSIRRNDLSELLLCGPKSIGLMWEKLRAQELPKHAYIFAKSLLHLLSLYRLQGWSNDYHNLISHTLPLPAQDKYAGVRSGEAFLSIEEEAVIVHHIDQLADILLHNPGALEIEEINDAAMLMCAYQFGMRPLQIAWVKLRDTRIWNDGDSITPSVHLTFPMLKQRVASSSKPLTRKVKHEWSILIREIYSKHYARGASGNDRLFSMGSGQEAGRRISELLAKLLPGGATATDLRHTAAQRLVDAGASQEELAEFLGHSDITTGLVYYATSVNQAERVNKALGLSSIYSRVAKIAHDKFISSDELASLKEDQQIAGVPHGIPIAGIGGCTSGQPLCPSNPILACYGCHKFMPIHEIGVHEQVLSDFRDIVRFFYESSRGDKDSPAYLQLQRTISSVEAIIDELREGAQ